MTESTTQGILKLDMHKVSAELVLEYAVDPIREQLQERQLELQLEVDPDLPDIELDLEKTAWVLANFLGNAVRYSPRWSTVIVKAEKDGDSVVLSVKDSGLGIKQDDLDRVFESLVHRKGKGRGTGLGLALALSKEIIEAMGGKIWAESAIGSGSRFCISMRA